MKRKSLLFLLLLALFAPLAMQGQGLMKAPRGAVLQQCPYQTNTNQEAPQTRDGWLQYDNGTHVGDYGLSSAYMWEFGPLYPASMLGNNNTLSKVSFWENSNMMAAYGVTINVYSPDTTTLIHQESFELNGTAGMHEVEFAQPVTFDPTQDLWITITVAGTYVFAVCQSTEANNDWVDWNGWRHGSEVGLTGLGWMIRGYVEYVDPASCPKPTQLIASDVTNHTATLSWNGEARSYQIVYSDNGSFDPDNATPIDVTETSYMLTDLLSSTTYYAYVRANCDGYYSPWSSMVDFTTDVPCSVPAGITTTDITASSANISWTSSASEFELRYAEDELVDDWHQYDDGTFVGNVGTGGGQFYWGVMFPAGSYSGNLVTNVSIYDKMAMTGSVLIYNDGTTAPASLMGSMDITLTGVEDFVEFDFSAPVEVDPTKNLWIIVYNESGATYPAAGCANTGDANGRWISLDGSSWMDVTVASSTLDYTWMIRANVKALDPSSIVWNIPSSSITNSSYNITDLDPETNYIAQVRANCDEDGYSDWATVAFTTLPLCQAPVLTLNDVTTTTATIIWTGEASTYNIKMNDELVAEGFTENTYTLNNLDPGTLYTVEVQSDCGDTGTSTWASVTFYTMCEAFNLPYEYGFDDVINIVNDYVCWEASSFNNENSIGFGWRDQEQGDIMLRFSSYAQIQDEETESYYQILVSPEFNTNAAVNVQFEYKTTLFNDGTASTENFVIGYSTSTDNLSDFTFLWDEEVEASTAEWLTYEKTLPEGTKYVAVLYTSEYQYYLFVDNFSFTESTGVTLPIALTQGWNWISLPIEVEDPAEALLMLEEALGGNALQIKARNNQVTQYDDEEEEWFGSLTGITNENMYMINMANAFTISLEGQPANPASHSITINPGWNWIGFPSAVAMSVEDALADFEAEENDELKGRIDGSTSFDGEDWFGTLQTLTPGQGYMYYFNGTEPKTLVIQTEAKARITQNNAIVEKPLREKKHPAKDSIKKIDNNLIKAAKITIDTPFSTR